jgi:hypothetical protein
MNYYDIKCPHCQRNEERRVLAESELRILLSKYNLLRRDMTNILVNADAATRVDDYFTARQIESDRAES